MTTLIDFKPTPQSTQNLQYTPEVIQVIHDSITVISFL